jgi:hypothetical protein
MLIPIKEWLKENHLPICWEGCNEEEQLRSWKEDNLEVFVSTENDNEEGFASSLYFKLPKDVPQLINALLGLWGQGEDQIMRNDLSDEKFMLEIVYD